MHHTLPCTVSGLLACVLLATPAHAQAPADTAKDAVKATAAEPAKDADKAPTPEEAADKAAEKELKRLRLEADLREQRLSAELASLKAEKAKLEAALALANAKQNAAEAPSKAEVDKLDQDHALMQAKLKAELSGSSTERERLKQARELQTAKLEAELADSKAQITRLASAQELLDAQHKAKLSTLKREQEELALNNALALEKRRAEQSRVLDEQMRADAEARTLSARLTYRDDDNKWKDAINAPVTYPDQPFKDGVLTISDRKIPPDGPIVSGTANRVCDRIDFYNNQDPTKPIFIVINNSPGGSVMEGYRILKAIESSKAPIHVVVKSFAASMAATIATLSPNSYAYPNAIILHHQMSSSASGNMTDIEQEVKTMQEWERRLADPIAKKMGITLDEFKSKMYSAKKSGDWDEFADRALALKWIDHIANEIREEGIRKKPGDKGGMPDWFFMLKTDESGKTYMSLPPLEPFDAYFMVNPRGFYRVEGR